MQAMSVTYQRKEKHFLMVMKRKRNILCMSLKSSNSNKVVSLFEKRNFNFLILKINVTLENLGNV